MNETIELEGMTFRKVQIFGVIYTPFDRNYYVLYHAPVERDSWQKDNQQRFIVVPCIPLQEKSYPAPLTTQDGKLVYSYARHVVLSCDFALETRFSTEDEGIWVWQLPVEHEQIIFDPTSMTDEELRFVLSDEEEREND